MKDRDDAWTDMAATAMFAVVLGISASWGQLDRAYDQACGRTGSAYGRMYEQAGPEGENGNPVSKADVHSGTAGVVRAAEDLEENPARSGGEDAEILLDVTGSQRTVLDETIEALEVQGLESVAWVMGHGEEELLTLFYEVTDGTRHPYDGQSFSLSIEGKGLALTASKILCYGASGVDRLEGGCTALQMVELGDPGYDYSRGLWRDGKMEGNGHIGYCYYESSPRGEARGMCKTGRFSDDRLGGEVTYITLNQEGETSTWKPGVKDGMVHLDNRWIHIEECEEYQLMPQEDDSHTYIMDEKLTGQPVRISPLVWEE